MPKISLIIALYNAKKYLRECLDSVAGQTFQDFEVLCVNDGSTDETAGIVKEYAKKDKRFRLIEQKNAGCSMARNKGLDEAKADYVALLDQDDVLHPQAFEALYYLIKKYKTDVATFRFKPAAENFKLKNPEVYDFSKIEGIVTDRLFERFFENKKGSQVEVWTRLYKKSAIKDICFPQDVQPAEDTVFTTKVMYHAKNMVSIPTELLFYRDSQTSVLNQGKTENYVRSHVRAAGVLHDYFIASKRLKGKDLANMEYYISRLIFKTCISQVLRRVKDAKSRKYLSKLSNFLVYPLYEKGIFKPETLGFRYSLASKAFLAKRYKLAKIFV